MPRYDYRCRKCGEELELQTPADHYMVFHEFAWAYEPIFNNEHFMARASCNGTMFRIWKQFPGIYFKGAGWNVDERRREKLEADQKALNREWASQRAIEIKAEAEKAFSEARPPTDQELQDFDNAIREAS